MKHIGGATRVCDVANGQTGAVPLAFATAMRAEYFGCRRSAVVIPHEARKACGIGQLRPCRFVTRVWQIEIPWNKANSSRASEETAFGGEISKKLPAAFHRVFLEEVLYFCCPFVEFGGQIKSPGQRAATQ